MSVEINTKLIKELRDATGISVMQCKKALEEAEGDMEKAKAILKKTSADIAKKKADRVANDGRVAVKSEGGKAILLGLHCETDFVSKNADFVSLTNTLLEKAWVEGVAKMKEDAKGAIDQVIQKVGENIELGEVIEVNGSVIGAYVHNDKSAVLVSLEGGNVDLAKDIAMHITAMKPEYMTSSEIDENAQTMMKEIFEKEVSESDKPEEIKAKMLEGKMNTYFKEKTLLSQPFIKDPNMTVEALLKKSNASLKEVKRYSI